MTVMRKLFFMSLCTVALDKLLLRSTNKRKNRSGLKICISRRGQQRVCAHLTK
jgi:hypothetical protein